ncbi:nucleotide exchange factor GrpE [Lachnospiraceae bacterium 62-35]
MINEENKNQEINDEAVKIPEEAVENAEKEAEESLEDVTDESSESVEEKEETGGKKGFFGKKKEKKDPRDEKIEELSDLLKRNMAEFDNFRKRTEKEKAAMFEMGAKDVVEKILPVVDNFERGLAALPEGETEDSFAKGMEMIYKQLMKALEDMGVKPIEALGKEFDPAFHNAVMHIEDDSLGENIIAAELQKGYMYRDSVVRHSMVQVAN